MAEDFSEIVEYRLRRFRPWGLYIAAWTGLMFSAPFVILALKGDGFFLALFMGIMSFLVLPAFPAAMRTFRCPSCGIFLGLRIEDSCPACGVKLRKLRVSATEGPGHENKGAAGNIK